MKITKSQIELPLAFKDNNEKEMAFEQYRLLVESLSSIHMIRESSNFFWIPINIGAVSAISYVREMESVGNSHKNFLMWTIIITGFVMCYSWIMYLLSIKNSLEARNKLLIRLEQYFPVPLFTNILYHQDDQGKSKLTITQLLVPCLFLSGYFFFSILLLFYTHEVVHSIGK